MRVFTKIINSGFEAKLLAVIGIISLICISCQPDPLLSIHTGTIDISNIEQTTRTNFVVNGPWEASSDSEWCDINPKSGDGSDDNVAVLEITTEANLERDTRTATITITSGAITKTITVNQAICDILDIDRETATFPYTADSLVIKISSNVSYDILQDDECMDWMTVVVPKYYDNGEIKVYFTENSGAERNGIIRINQYNGSISKVFTLTQETGYVNIPDPLFESYCIQSFDYNLDKHFSYFEAKIPTYVAPLFADFQSIEGIEHFESLEILYAKNMSLTSLNLSNNSKLTTLDCSNNKIANADMHGLTKLVTVNLDNNPLTSLDVDGCNSITSLSIRKCGLSDIDLRSLTQLKSFYAQGNQFTTIDLTGNENLTNLNLDDSPITELDLSRNTKLKNLACSNTKLKEIDLSNNPDLSDIDLSSNPDLEVIWLKKGKSNPAISYDKGKATVKYKE